MAAGHQRGYWIERWVAFVVLADMNSRPSMPAAHRSCELSGFTIPPFQSNLLQLPLEGLRESFLYVDIH